jgi:uncharacterized repeat protein (TIGR01451 family)
MKTHLYSLHTLKKASSILLLSAFLLVTSTTKAQFRNYSKVFSDNIKGGSTIFGNTLTHVITNGNPDTARMNNNRANGNGNSGNDNANIQHVDVDGNTGIGAGTRNSSSASLHLPAGTNQIKLARLYWGGRVKSDEYNLSLDTFRRVKISFNNGNYTEYTAAQLDKNTTGVESTVSQYQAYVDITPFIQANGSGSYTVGNIAASIGAASNGGNYAGWCIVVVYQNASLNYNSVRVYDGFQQVYNGGSSLATSVTLTGLNIPSGPISNRDAKMGVMVWEGDANLKQDYLKINGASFYNTLNAVNNPWNGTITDTGSHVTTKYPDYTNQMGIDIDQFYVGSGYGIQPGDTEVKLEFGTEADQYFPGLFTFQITTKAPTVLIDKSVKDANANRIAEANEELTYTLRGTNTGEGNANFCVILDTLPQSVHFIPGSIKINSCPGITANISLTDAGLDDQGDYNSNDHVLVFRIGTGANQTQGGILAPGESFEIEYKVKVNNPGNGHVPPIINVARIAGFSDAGVLSTDDGTAILEPLGGPLPVTLQLFNAWLQGATQVKLSWATSMEINSQLYEIESSTDGRYFSVAGTIAAAGNTALQSNYSYTDNIGNTASSIIYYRLRQVDMDGRSSYSKVISVRIKKATSAFTVSPNPFKTHVNINLEWDKTETANVQVLTISGSVAATKTVQLNKGTNYVAIGDIEKLQPGMYIIQFNTSQGKIYKQVIKQ